VKRKTMPFAPCVTRSTSDPWAVDFARHCDSRAVLHKREEIGGNHNLDSIA
jgi:hypothetical protein